MRVPHPLVLRLLLLISVHAQAALPGAHFFEDEAGWAASAQVSRERAGYRAACANASEAACDLSPLLRSLEERYLALDRVAVLDWQGLGLKGLGTSRRGGQPACLPALPELGWLALGGWHPASQPVPASQLCRNDSSRGARRQLARALYALPGRVRAQQPRSRHYD